MLSKGVTKENNDPRHAAHNADLFVKIGCEYYAAARWAMEAQRPLICGILFHHAVEMLLKGGLAKNGKKSLAELEHMRHSLRALWKAYKADHPEAGLNRHDKTIKGLDKHEDIRYPDPSLHSVGIGLQWSGEPPKAKTFGGLRSPKEYGVTVDDIDSLVADFFRASSWRPGAFMGYSEAALEAIRRYNKHATFLTT
jgi:hypothetical protein